MKAKSLFCLLLALLLGLMACTPAADESSATESPDGSEPAVESSAPEESGSEEPFDPPTAPSSPVESRIQAPRQSTAIRTHMAAN